MLASTRTVPILVARVVRWVILPTRISTDNLLRSNIRWDILVILEQTEVLAPQLQALVAHAWTLTIGIPSRLTRDFARKNEELLRPARSTRPALTGSLENPLMAPSPQGLELSPPLLRWIQDFAAGEGAGPVSMLNLLAFKENMKAEYLKYGSAFAKSIGSLRGGDAKLVGSVLRQPQADSEEGGWDEIAVAHYPSILHFADMIASEDYQAVNHRSRLPALKDTFILCCTELNLPWPSSLPAARM